MHEVARAGFGRSAEAYDRARPDYPEEAIDWLWTALGLRRGDRVVDVGAGTGKLSRRLAERGAEVVAIEPVEAMRARLAANAWSPTVTAMDARAERLPIDDAWAGSVVSGQAFHWFANKAALGEFHRVLRTGGRLGLIWNRRRLEDPTQAAISELLEPYRGEAPRHASDAWRLPLERSPLFAEVETHEVGFVQVLDRAGLVDRVGSTSFVAALDHEPREALLARVASLVDASGVARLPYLSEAFVHARRD